MQDRTADAYDAQMQTYREHLRRSNRRLAEDYARQNAQHVILAIEALAQAAPVTLAIAQLHHAIRCSPARNFWPVIRKTKGMLFVGSADSGQDRPWPWQRTKTGNMRYALPGSLLFSPWLPNVRRRVRSRTIELERVSAIVQSGENDFWFEIASRSIFFRTLQAKRLIDEIRALQGFAMPDCIAALDRWSGDAQRGSNIALRISQGTLVYSDGRDRCEIEIPAALTPPLSIPSTPDRELELHLVRAGRRSYYP
ncbi:hypothetical protein LQG66_08065 [Bradyrhizobium ontarionense]|uniref:Uncharacterized protein n=1 Tax=Bradyrhizobium ontarionense TaxID=2898149 RepID=A0ABY3RFP5_9BRAD|nr:hypothetical protein [Bradyrhizobium sp. A19]UFZ06241.1 hypothetical protein LQG66_08065 [Bradyrhizobium sp. A19]